MSVASALYWGFRHSLYATRLRRAVDISFWAPASFPVHFKIRYFALLNAGVCTGVPQFQVCPGGHRHVAFWFDQHQVCGIPYTSRWRRGFPSPKSESVKNTAHPASSGSLLQHLASGRGGRRGKGSLSFPGYRPRGKTKAPPLAQLPVSSVRPFFAGLSAEHAAS